MSVDSGGKGPKCSLSARTTNALNSDVSHTLAFRRPGGRTADPQRVKWQKSAPCVQQLKLCIPPSVCVCGLVPTTVTDSDDNSSHNKGATVATTISLPPFAFSSPHFALSLSLCFFYVTLRRRFSLSLSLKLKLTSILRFLFPLSFLASGFAKRALFALVVVVCFPFPE